MNHNLEFFMHHPFIKILIILSLTTCTKNTLFDNDLGSSDGVTLRGKILLDKDSPPDSIYVWLGILNLGTYTDTGGNFNLYLPPAESQPQNGISGTFQLYYYIANYKIASSTVTLLNGKFIYNKSDINREGVIHETITLKKLLTINAAITPTTYPQDYHDYIEVTLFIKNIFEPVVIQTFKYQRDNNMFTHVYFRDINDSLENTFLYRLSTLLREEEIRGERHWYMLIHTDSIRLNTGSYEVIPYIKVLQNNIPKGLMESMGEDPVFIDYTYLKIPFKRQNAYLTVTPEEGRTAKLDR
jgi:hypothetical protein